MIALERLIRLLSEFPAGSSAHGYEGEDTGITVDFPNGGFGFIHACERDGCERCETQEPERVEPKT